MAEHLVHPMIYRGWAEAIGKPGFHDQHTAPQLEHRVVYADGGVGYIS